MKLSDELIQIGCTAYADKFLQGGGTMGDGIEAAFFAIVGSIKTEKFISLTQEIVEHRDIDKLHPYYNQQRLD